MNIFHSLITRFAELKSTNQSDFIPVQKKRPEFACFDYLFPFWFNPFKNFMIPIKF